MQKKAALFFFFCLFPFIFSLVHFIPFYFFPPLSISSLYLFCKISLYCTIKKDTSCDLTLLAAKKCSATRSTTRNTSPGSSKTIPHLRRKQKKSKKIHHSGQDSNNSPYSIRQQNGCLIFLLLSFPFYFFPSSFYPFLFFPPLSISSLYLFYKISLYCTIKKDTS